MKKWFASELGYAVDSGSSSFTNVIAGRKIPTAERRKQLAELLAENLNQKVYVRDLWRLDNGTGKIVAIRHSDKRNQRRGRSTL